MAAVKVKICGITNLEDAEAAAEAGCDALGFVFYEKSPRYIAPDKARRIVASLAPHLVKIGIFADAEEQTVRCIAKLCNLDILQFHGKESPEFCSRFKDYKVIKAFRIKDKADLKNMSRYRVFAYLFDTFVSSKIGGTGKKFNWALLRNIAGIKRPIFLSGGLTVNNVKEAIKVVKPDWLDVSSSVEIRPGKKDPGKVKEFIEAAKNK